MEIMIVLAWVVFALFIKILRTKSSLDDNNTNPTNPHQNSAVKSPHLVYWLKTLTALPIELQSQAMGSLNPQEQANLGIILADFSQNKVEWPHLPPAALAAMEKVRHWLQTRSLEAHLVLFNALSQDCQLEVLASLDKDGVIFSVLNNEYLDSGSFSEPPALLNQWDFIQNLHQSLSIFSGLTWGKNPEEIDQSKIQAAMSLTHFAFSFPILSQEHSLT